jgi:hypothetical protein
MEKIPKFMRKRKSFVAGIRQLVDYTMLNEIEMVEVGSYAGESAELFVGTGKIKEIVCVDPWENGYDKSDGGSERRSMKEVEKIFDKRMENSCKGKYRKIKGTSEEASTIFKDQSLDLVYIDGNHQYKAVSLDIKKWLPKVKSGGYISGHDWSRDGVKRAIEESIGTPCSTFSDDSWIASVDKLRGDQ